MSNKCYARFMRNVTRITLSILLAASFALFCEVATLTPCEIVSTYHSFPYMLEHLLVGVVLYLAFSLITAKIHASSMYDR